MGQYRSSEAEPAELSNEQSAASPQVVRLIEQSAHDYQAHPWLCDDWNKDLDRRKNVSEGVEVNTEKKY